MKFIDNKKSILKLDGKLNKFPKLERRFTLNSKKDQL